MVKQKKQIIEYLEYDYNYIKFFKQADINSKIIKNKGKIITEVRRMVTFGGGRGAIMRKGHMMASKVMIMLHFLA